MECLARQVALNVSATKPFTASRRQQVPAAAAWRQRRQPVQQRRGPRTMVPRAQQLEEIDPMTGEVIAGTAMASEAPERVEAGGLTFAFRKFAANPTAAAPGKLPVLCLHGLGSSSYTFRATGSLLAQDGHDVIAVDWPGHGVSSKVRRRCVLGCTCSHGRVARVPAPALAPWHWPERIPPPPPLPCTPQPTSGFDYSPEAYIAALDKFVAAVGLAGQPFAVIVHGFVLGQYGMLWALENAGRLAGPRLWHRPSRAGAAAGCLLAWHEALPCPPPFRTLAAGVGLLPPGTHPVPLPDVCHPMQTRCQN